MTKEEPLDEALYEIKNIIGMLQANLFKMVSVKEIQQAEPLFQKIEQAIDKFEKKAFAELKEVGLTQEQKDLLNEGKLPDTIKGEQREALQIAIDLKQQIEELKLIALKEQGFSEEAEEQEQSIRKKKKDKKLSKHEHKKKYKRLGGNDWKPL